MNVRPSIMWIILSKWMQRVYTYLYLYLLNALLFLLVMSLFPATSPKFWIAGCATWRITSSTISTRMFAARCSPSISSHSPSSSALNSICKSSEESHLCLGKLFRSPARLVAFLSVVVGISWSLPRQLHDSIRLNLVIVRSALSRCCCCWMF